MVIVSSVRLRFKLSERFILIYTMLAKHTNIIDSNRQS